MKKKEEDCDCALHGGMIQFDCHKQERLSMVFRFSYRLSESD